MANKILVDATIWVAMISTADPKHKLAENIFEQALLDGSLFFTNNYLLSESITMILLRTKNIRHVQFLRNNILEKHKNIITVYQATKDFDNEIYNLFITQIKYKGDFLSFADCSLIIQARVQEIQTIFTFDKTLKQFGKEFDIVGV